MKPLNGHAHSDDFLTSPAPPARTAVPATPSARRAAARSSQFHRSAGLFDQSLARFDQSNPPFNQSPAPFDWSRPVFDQSNPPCDQSNRPRDQSNSAFDRSLGPFDQSNSAFDRSNVTPRRAAGGGAAVLRRLRGSYRRRIPNGKGRTTGSVVAGAGRSIGHRPDTTASRAAGG